MDGFPRVLLLRSLITVFRVVFLGSFNLFSSRFSYVSLILVFLVFFLRSLMAKLDLNKAFLIILMHEIGYTVAPSGTDLILHANEVPYFDAAEAIDRAIPGMEELVSRV